MKKLLVLLLVFVLVFNTTSAYALTPDQMVGMGTQESSSSTYSDGTSEPMFIVRGLKGRTVTLSDVNGESIKFVSCRNGDPSYEVETTLTAEWITAFDPNIGYSANAPRFYIPDGMIVDNVVINDSAKILSNEEGYEWRGIKVVLSIPTYGCQWYNTYEDYYTLQQYDVDGDQNIFTRNGNTLSGNFTLSCEGKSYDKCSFYEFEQEDQANSTFTVYFFLRVPTGYDGCVIGFLDARGTAYEKGQHVAEFDNVPRGAGDVYFRLK